MTLRTTLLGFGFALVSGAAFALPPPPPPPDPSAVVHDIGAGIHHAAHPREWRHRHQRLCTGHNHRGHCTRWARHRHSIH